MRQEIENETKTITSLQSQIDGNAQIKLLSGKIVEERGRLHRLKEKLLEFENLNVRYGEILIFLSNCFEEIPA